MSYKTDKFDQQAIDIVRHGGIGLVPSDTVYGLSCQALNEAAVARLHSLKRREGNKPFIILISSINQLKSLGIDKKDAFNIFKYWPGPVSAVLPCTNAPSWLDMGTSTLAVRLPDNKQLLDFINQVGPIVSTSANLHKQEPATDAQAAEKLFGDSLELYIDKGVISGLPSTIVKVDKDNLEVLRQGSVKIDNID